MDMTIAINEALTLLDPEDDSHWTVDDLPRMDIIEGLLDDKSITRQNVTDANPGFSRGSANVTSTEEVAQAREAVVLDDQPMTKLQLDEQIQVMDQEIASLQRARNEIARERDQVQEAEFGGHSPADDTKARLAYIKSQHEIRMARAGRRANIFKMVSAGDIAKGSQLDAAMSRKTARGTQRPQRPPL